MSAPVCKAVEADQTVAALAVVAEVAHAHVLVTAVAVVQLIQLLALADGTQPAKVVDRARTTHWHAALLCDAVACGAADDTLFRWVGTVVAPSYHRAMLATFMTGVVLSRAHAFCHAFKSFFLGKSKFT